MKEMRPIIFFISLALIVTEAGMLVCFLLFYSVDPVISIGLGSIAGQNVKKLFWMIFLMPILFLIGTFVFFTATEPLFWIYALVYLGLGAVSMLITAFIIKKIKK